MSNHDGRKGTAVATLSYYLRRAFEEAGLQWDQDSDSEIESIVDAIVREAVLQIKEGKNNGCD